MTQKIKMLAGVAVVLAAGYYLWTKSKKPKGFANFNSGFVNLSSKEKCGCHADKKDDKFICRDGSFSFNSQGKCK